MYFWFSVSCNKCCNYIDFLKSSRRNNRKSNKEKTKRNQHKHPWNFAHAESSGKALKHEKTCECLQMKIAIVIIDECNHEKKTTRSTRLRVRSTKEKGKTIDGKKP